MRETKLYSRLRLKFSQWENFSFDRIENSVGSGTWDIFYTTNGLGGWIETKVEKGGKLYFEKYQRNWALKHLKAGFDRLYVLAECSEEMKVFHAMEIVEAGVEVKGKWLTIEVSKLIPSLVMSKPYDWEALRTLLSE